MSELAELRQDVRSLRQTIAVLCNQMGTRLSREQMCDRYQVSRNTLTRMIETGKVPRPVNGKWLLSEVVEWDDRLKSSGQV